MNKEDYAFCVIYLYVSINKNGSRLFITVIARLGWFVWAGLMIFSTAAVTSDSQQVRRMSCSIITIIRSRIQMATNKQVRDMPAITLLPIPLPPAWHLLPLTTHPRVIFLFFLFSQTEKDEMTESLNVVSSVTVYSWMQDGKYTQYARSRGCTR